MITCHYITWLPLKGDSYGMTQRHFIDNFFKKYTTTVINKLLNNFYNQVIIIYCKNQKKLANKKHLFALNKFRK
jgi:hypothetical protein